MEKTNKKLVILVIILSLLVVGLGGFIVYDKVLSDDKIEDKNQGNNIDSTEKDNNSTDGVQDIDDGGTLVGSFQNYDINNVKKDTKIVGLGCDEKTTMYVENGNIILSNGVGKLTIKTNNAKYIYSYGYMECGTYYFFYITDDGQLYTFKLWFGSGIQQNETITMEDLQYNNNLQRVGVRDGDKFVGFLGIGNKVYENGANVHIVGVLNDKNEEKYYAFFLTYFN